MESPELARMRSEYARDGIDEAAAGDDPLSLFSRWLDEAVAAGLDEPNAMALATATPDGLPRGSCC
jgi:pyridoxamine 5'-phosphate oxidase